MLANVEKIETKIEQLHSYETRNNIYSNIYTKIQTIIPYYTMLWAKAKDEKDCLLPYPDTK